MDFKQLLGESVSDEVITQLNEGITNTISEAVKEKDDELEEMKKELDETKKELEEKKCEAEKAKDELTESAEAYGEKLKEEFSLKEAEYVQKIADITETAEAYGEYVKQEITESAEAYTNQFINEYKEQHSAKFKALEENTKATDALENVKNILECFNYSLDEQTLVSDLQESVVQKDEEIKQLKEELCENNIAKQKELILEEATQDLSLNEKADVVEAAGNILTEDVEGFKKVVNILVSKKDSNTLVENTSQKINENINTNKEGLFGKLSNKSPEVQEIVDNLI